MELRLAVSRSRLLTGLLLVWGMLAVVAAFVSSLPSSATYCLVALIIWAIFRGVSCHSLRFDHRSVAVLTLDPGSSDCSVRLKDGAVLLCRLGKRSVVWPGLMVLNLSAIDSSGKKSFALPLMKDAVFPAEWRKLSILLRQLAIEASR